MSSTLMLLMLLPIAVAFVFVGIFVSLCVFFGTPPTARKQYANRALQTLL